MPTADINATAPADSDLRPLDPRVRTMWWVQAGLQALVSVVAALGVTVVVGGPIAVATGAAAALSVVLGVIIPPLRYARWRYLVRSDDIWVRQGLFVVTVTVVPFSRLQFVDTSRGPLDRLFGLASLSIYTAALGAQTSIPGLALEEAEHLREQLADVDPDVQSI